MRQIVMTLVAGLCAAAALWFVFALRVPVYFDGSSIVIAAVMAFVATLTVLMVAPASFLWSEAERLRHAFRLRHGLSETRSGLVMTSILTAHQRADAIRQASKPFAEDLRERSIEIADRMDLIARQIFYHPERLAAHRSALVRSELIEEALTAHAKLRRTRGHDGQLDQQVAASREKISAALASLDDAFNAAAAQEANKLLDQVDTASATAELLLNRGRAPSSGRTNP